MVVLLITLSTLVAATLGVIARHAARPRTSGRPADAGGEHRIERIEGRILFVDRREDHIVLDCVAGTCHPSQCSLPPGTPFALTVEPAGPSWFGEAVESMVARWADEDAVVDILVVAGPDGERVDVRGARSRVRLDVRHHAGLA